MNNEKIIAWAVMKDGECLSVRRFEPVASGEAEGVEFVPLVRFAEQPPQQEPVSKYCCHLCFNKSGQIFLDRMILCPECGNKRCPKATHHGLPCTKSNDVGQSGSIYDQPTQLSKPLTDEQIREIMHKSVQDAYGTGRFEQMFARAIEAAHGIKGDA